ncbi:hypothetical protein IJG72_07965 [bacterium]|nr:hypothetical protein [bacterium]
MNKKLLTALIVSLAATAPTIASSDLENAINSDVEQYIMGGNQSVTANLTPQTGNSAGRIFVINDDQEATNDHYFNILGNNHSGFNFQEGAMALNNVDTVSGFKTNGNGGAFCMTDDADLEWWNFVDKDHLGTITGNTATGNGGGIYSDGNYAGAVQLHGVSVTNNHADGKGGGIYASYGTHSIFANSGAVLNFTGNTSSLGGDDIYLTDQAWMRIVSRGNGTATATVNVGDIRLDNKSELYIVTPQADAGAGVVNITNMQLSNGSKLDFTKDYKHANTTINNLSLKGSSILNTANKYIENSLNITNISLDSSKNMFMVDADLREATLGIDQFNNVSGGNINLVVNVIGADGNTPGTLTLFNGTVDSNLTIADSSTIYGTNKYTFKQNPNNKGQLLVSKERSGDAVTLQYALATYDENEYELPTFTVLTADLGELVLVDDEDNPITREFVLKGENGFLTSEGYNGVVINGQQDHFGTKFTAENISAVAGFVNEQADEADAHAKGSFISAQEADLNISNSLIYANNAHAQGTNAVAKGGAISIENLINDTQLHTTTISNVEFDSNNATSDKSYAYGGAIHSKFNNLNIENSTFTNNIADGKSTAQGGAINFENLYPSELEGIKLNIKDTTFENNSAISQGSSPAMGGALAITGNEGPSVEVNLENVIFKGNNVTTKSSNIDRYALGGAIYNDNGRISLKNVQFIDNTATSSTSGTTVYSDITNRGINGSVTFSGGDTTLKGGIVNRYRTTASGGHVIVTDGANLTFADTSKLQQGSLIINNGTVTVNSTDTNNTLDRLSVASGSSLTLNSAMVVGTDNEAGETINNGTITNNSDSFVIGKSGSESVGDRIFTNNGTINGEGEIELTYSTLDNNGTITNDVTLTKSEAVLNSKYENLTGNVTLSNAGATYNILSDSVTFDDANRIQGTAGKLYVGGNILSDAQLNYTGDVYLRNGAAVTLGNGDAFQNVGNLWIGTGEDDIVLATLNVLNGTPDALNYGNKLHLGQYSELGIDMDWGDTLSVDSTYINNSAKLNINKLDISNANGGDNYTFAVGAKNIVSLANVDLITATGMANSVTYNNGTGLLTAKRDTLANVVRTSDITDDENAYYNYSMDSNEQGSSTNSVIGNLKVQGNGNSIVTKGLIVGDVIDSGHVILKDTNISNVNATAGSGAILVNNDSTLTIQAEEHDVTLSGTTGANKTAIYMATGAGNPASTVTFEANNGKTITIDDDIISNNPNNQVIFNNGTINVNGVMDPLTAVNAGADVTRGGQDADVQWRLNGGTLTYLKDSYLNNPAKLNSMEFAGGNLDLRNGVATTIALNDLQITGASNLYVDADLAAGTMDRFTNVSSNPATGTLSVAGINLLSDAKANTTTINFTSDPNLMGNINYSGTALSRIFKYNVGYDNTNGNFNFTRSNTGSYTDFNPSVLAGSVAAQVGGYLTQLNSYDEAFYNMDMYMLMTKEQRQALKMKNHYAAADGGLLYDSTMYRQERAEGWFRPYATFEKVGLRRGPKVENTAYGTYMGGESQLYDLGHGWDGMWGAYVGYNGSHQNYNGVSIYQNGGTLGLTGMAYKGNFFTGLTLNAGASAGEASTMFGNEDFAMLMAGIASKTGYNWELANGKFIIQPSWLMSYSFVNTFDYTNAAGVRIDSDPLHAIQLQPELKFIGNLKNGWQPYASVAMVWNIMDDTKFKANDAALPEMSVKPYVKYGVGIRKTWGERFAGFFQTYLTNGGRNGVGLQAGFTWALGKDPSKVGDSHLNKTPELKKTEISLNNHR